MFNSISADEVREVLAAFADHEEAWHELDIDDPAADDILVGLVEAGMRAWATPDLPRDLQQSLFDRIGRSDECRCLPEEVRENFRRMAGPEAPQFLAELRKEPGEEDLPAFKAWLWRLAFPEPA